MGDEKFLQRECGGREERGRESLRLNSHLYFVFTGSVDTSYQGSALSLEHVSIGGSGQQEVRLLVMQRKLEHLSF